MRPGYGRRAAGRAFRLLAITSRAWPSRRLEDTAAYLAGTVAGFLASLALCLAVVFSRHLPMSWAVLAVVIFLANSLLELFSPRGTDALTMATANALLCWGFGVLVY